MNGIQTERRLNVMMAGGGSGGHVFPIKSLIDTGYEMLKSRFEIGTIFWAGSKGSLEEEVAKELGNKVKFLPIWSGKWRREKEIGTMGRNIVDIFKLGIGIIQSFYLILKYKIDVIFCKGGYVALPMVIAGKILGKRLIVHESDTSVGLVNRIASRWAEVVFTGSDIENKMQCKSGKLKVVGQILGEELFLNCQTTATSPLVIPRIFVIAGSQGAKTLYEELLKVFGNNPALLKSFKVSITLGKLNQEMKADFEQLGIETFEFLNQREMGKHYAEADICITRGGTTSLAEQKLFNCKSIIIPLPRTHDQAGNARFYVENYGDIMLEQNSFSFNDELEKTLEGLVGYRKEASKGDVLSQIQEVKRVIWDAILTGNPEKNQ